MERERKMWSFPGPMWIRNDNNLYLRFNWERSDVTERQKYIILEENLLLHFLQGPAQTENLDDRK